MLMTNSNLVRERPRDRCAAEQRDEIAGMLTPTGQVIKTNRPVHDRPRRNRVPAVRTSEA